MKWQRVGDIPDRVHITFTMITKDEPEITEFYFGLGRGEASKAIREAVKFALARGFVWPPQAGQAPRVEAVTVHQPSQPNSQPTQQNPAPTVVATPRMEQSTPPAIQPAVVTNPASGGMDAQTMEAMRNLDEQF